VHCWVVVEGDNTGDELGLGGGLFELDQLASNAALEGIRLAPACMLMMGVSQVWRAAYLLGGLQLHAHIGG
jgi:hypothetical protein